MRRARPCDDRLLDISHHRIWYEITIFMRALTTLRNRKLVGNDDDAFRLALTVETPLDWTDEAWTVRRGLFEVALIHARSLIEFFETRHDDPALKDDAVVAEDFLEHPEAWRMFVKRHETDWASLKRWVNKAIAHVSAADLPAEPDPTPLFELWWFVRAFAKNASRARLSAAVREVVRCVNPEDAAELVD